MHNVIGQYATQFMTNSDDSREEIQVDLHCKIMMTICFIGKIIILLLEAMNNNLWHAGQIRYINMITVNIETSRQGIKVDLYTKWKWPNVLKNYVIPISCNREIKYKGRAVVLKIQSSHSKI